MRYADVNMPRFHRLQLLHVSGRVLLTVKGIDRSIERLLKKRISVHLGSFRGHLLRGQASPVGRYHIA